VLPSENPYEALIVGLERHIAQIERDPHVPSERKEREASRWRSVLATLRDVGTDFGAKLIGQRNADVPSISPRDRGSRLPKAEAIASRGRDSGLVLVCWWHVVSL